MTLHKHILLGIHNRKSCYLDQAVHNVQNTYVEHSMPRSRSDEREQ